MFHISLVDPREQPEVVADFCLGQAVAYSDFGAERAATPILEEEIDDGCVQFLTTRDEDTGEIVGGLRLYMRREGYQLPVERLLGAYPALLDEIKALSHRGVAEIGGTWVQSSWRGQGLGVELYRFAAAIMPLLNISRGLAFSHHRVIPAWKPLGWVVDANIRGIDYPDARYRSSVIWIDPLTLHHADAKQYHLTMNLRAALRQGLPIRWTPRGPQHDLPATMAAVPR